VDSQGSVTIEKTYPTLPDNVRAYFDIDENGNMDAIRIDDASPGNIEISVIWNVMEYDHLI